MESDKLLHDVIVERLRRKFSAQYKEIQVNEGGSPDLILANHGLTLAVVEVETETTVTQEKAAQWKQMASTGQKLILMVPKNTKVRAMELLWQEGIADRVGVGSYEIAITMP
jgi:hypothetical protein